MRSIIGIVGEAGTGKGEISSFLAAQGFLNYSLSNSLRKVATDLGLPHDREVLIKIGNSLREKFGGDILAQGARQWAEKQEGDNLVIESIRNPSEVTYLQKELGAFVIGITMSPEKRFELMRTRKRPGDPETWEEFQNLLKREHGIGEEETGQQLQKCLQLADIVLLNESSIETLQANTRELLISRGTVLEGYNPNTERK